MKDLQKGSQHYTGKELSVSEAITSKLPALESIEAHKGAAHASAIVAREIMEMMKGLSFTVNENYIQIASDGIIRRFGDVNEADLIAFRNMVLRGEIGNTLYRMDGREIVKLFEEYYDRRVFEQEQLIQRYQDAWRRAEKMPTAEEIQRAYARMRAEKPEPKKKETVDVAALIKGTSWKTCEHEWSGNECVRCGSVING